MNTDPVIINARMVADAAGQVAEFALVEGNRFGMRVFFLL